MTKRDDMPALPEPFVKPLAANGLASKPGLYTVGQLVRYAQKHAEQRVREERSEDERLLREAMEALITGRDALHELAARYHDEMRFHYPDVHASMDSDVVRADAAIAALRKRLGE